MKILVTGSSGFIGKHVVKELKERGHTVLELTRSNGGDLNRTNWKRRVKKFSPEAAIHLAWLGIPDIGLKNSLSNLEMSFKLFQYLSSTGCKKIVSTGSAFEYDTENKRHLYFNVAKNTIRELGEALATDNNTSFIWLRLFFVYGEGQRSASLIPTLLSGGEAKTPNAKNDFVNVEDVARAIVHVTENVTGIGTYDIGTGKAVKVKKVVKIVADMKRTKRDLKWQPIVTLKEGIKQLLGK
jgi:nucleoside-diphosphate-sugar epimerase